MSVHESTTFKSFCEISDRFLDHKATWITTFVVSILAIVTASLIIAQQYGGLGHGFSCLDKVPLGATYTMFGVGGFLLSYSVGKFVKSVCLLLEENKCKELVNVSRIEGQIGSPCEWGYAAVDQTYEGSRGSNCDFSYADPDLGLVLVVDGSGHNNPAMHRALKLNLEQKFLPKIKEGLAQKFSSEEQAKDWLKKEIESFAKILSEDPTVIIDESSSEGVQQKTLKDTSYRPAMSLGFIATVNNAKYFIHYQTGDTTFTIKRDDQHIYLPALHPGQGVMATGEFSKVARATDPLSQCISSTRLEEKDLIVGCSDGITEFLTEEQFGEWLKEEPQDMLSHAKMRIEENASLPGIEETSSAQSAFWPKFKNLTRVLSSNLEHQGQYDDISVAVLKVR